MYDEPKMSQEPHRNEPMAKKEPVLAPDDSRLSADAEQLANQLFSNYSAEDCAKMLQLVRGNIANRLESILKDNEESTNIAARNFETFNRTLSN